MDILIRVKDRIHPDPVKNAFNTKRGDVVEILPEDGRQWGRLDLSNPDYRIIRISGVTPTERLAFKRTGRRHEMPDGTFSLPRQRDIYIDLDDPSIPLVVRNWINDDKRAVPLLDLSGRITLAQLRSLVKTRDPYPDPRILG